MRIRSRRSAALLVSLAMTAGVLAFAAPASADVEPAPGPITFTATDGVIKAGNAANETTGGPHGIILPLSCTPGNMLPEFPAVNLQAIVDAGEEPCDPNAPAPQLSGTIEPDGTIEIDNIEFPETEPAEALPGVMVAMNIQAAGPATGTIDPEAGTLEMFVNLAINVDISSDFLNGVCDIPLNLHLTGTYNPATGKALIADNSFAIVVQGAADPNPSCNPAGLAGLVGTITGSMASGLNVVRFAMDVDPVITQVIPDGPPVVNDLARTIALGGSTSGTITSLVNPAQTCALVGPNGGATLGTASVNGFTVSYSHNLAAGHGVDTVDYECTNDIDTDTGTLTVQILGNECQAGEPGVDAVGCSLEQLIEFDILGAELSMSQEDANVTLGTITLNGAPQTTTGAMNDITVVNKRGDGQEWDLSGQVSDFKTQGHEANCPANVSSSWDYRCIPGDNLGWSPAAEVAHQVVPGDVAAVTAGSVISAADIAAGVYATNGNPGLGRSAHTLCSAAQTTSGGTFACGAGLALVVPASAAAGTYNATLTLTLS